MPTLKWHWLGMTAFLAFLRSAITALGQRGASALVLVAIAVQALVPGGYMLGASPNDGSIAITLCTNSGMISAFIDEDGQITEAKKGSQSPDPDPDTNDTNPVCAFVGHATAAFVPSHATVPPQDLAFETQVSLTFSSTLYPGLGLAAPPPPKTGPPIHA